jgi:hypothetical protein
MTTLITRPVFALLVAICMVGPGCATLVNVGGDGQTTAYLIGYTTTGAYLLEKDRVSQDTQEAIKLVWESFDAVMSTLEEEDLGRVKERLHEELDKRIGGSTSSFISFTINMLDKYILRAEERFDFASMKRNDVYLVLKELHQGIADGIEDHNAV